jgi:hypothetical protein
MTHDPRQDTDSTSGSVLNDEAESVFEGGTRCSEIKMELRDLLLSRATGY